MLSLRNTQRTRPLRLPLLRRMGRHLLEKELALRDYELGVHLIDATEMAGLNEQFLEHEGSTDVITFDHGSSARRLHGEIFISVPDALKQARQFKTTWPSELVRYLIHGLLHLRGFDDVTIPKRRLMKREEERLLRRLAATFPLARLAAPDRPKRHSSS